MLNRHTFQFISFCHVRHREHRETGKANINTDCHLLHITQGTGTVCINLDQTFELASGRVIAIPHGTPFTMRIAPDFEMLNLHYEIWTDDGPPISECFRLPYSFRPSYFAESERLLREMSALPPNDDKTFFRKASHAYQIIMDHYACQALTLTAPPIIDRRIARAAAHLQSDQRAYFDIAELEEIACLSRSQFNRKFRDAFGVSPHQFWERHRFRVISLEIRRADTTIEEIASMYGFSSPFYFSRWFKKIAGHSPSAFRNHRVPY